MIVIINYSQAVAEIIANSSSLLITPVKETVDETPPRPSAVVSKFAASAAKAAVISA